MDDLQSRISAITAVDSSLTSLFDGIATLITTNVNSPEKLNELARSLSTEGVRLVDSLLVNTGVLAPDPDEAADDNDLVVLAKAIASLRTRRQNRSEKRKRRQELANQQRAARVAVETPAEKAARIAAESPAERALREHNEAEHGQPKPETAAERSARLAKERNETAAQTAAREKREQNQSK